MADPATSVAAARTDVAVSSLVDGQEAADQIAAGVGRVIERLAAVLVQVTEKTDEIWRTSHALAEGSPMLADSLQRQKKSVHEVHETVETLRQSVADVRAKTRRADRTAGKMNRRVAQGADPVVKSVEAMQRIRTSSIQVGEIIHIISEITRQANLLAINATLRDMAVRFKTGNSRP
jgi:methyl-accepting chemotaxis protein